MINNETQALMREALLILEDMNSQLKYMIDHVEKQNKKLQSIEEKIDKIRQAQRGI